MGNKLLIYVITAIILIAMMTSAFLGMTIAMFHLRQPIWIGYFIAAILIALGFEPIKKILTQTIDTLLYRQHFLLRKRLLDLANELNNLADIIDLHHYVVHELAAILKTKNIIFYQASGLRPGQYYPKAVFPHDSAAPIKTIHTKDILLYPLLKYDKPIFRYDLETSQALTLKGSNELLEFFNQQHVDVGIPLTRNHITWGVLFLGPKTSLIKYSRDEEILLKRLSQTLVQTLEKRSLCINLEEEKTHIENAIKTLNEGIIIVDPNGTILMENAIAAQLFIKKQPFKHLAIQEMMAAEEDVFQLALLHPNGSSYSCFKLSMKEEKTLQNFTIFTFRNTSQLNRKVMEKSEFLAFAANNLIKPTQRMKTHAHKTEADESIIKAAETSELLARKMVYFSELDAGPLRIQKRPVYLPELITIAISKMPDSLQKICVFDINISTTLHEIKLFLDKEFITDALYILIDIFAQCQNQTASAAADITINANANLEKKLVTLTLTGPGTWLPEPERRRIFNKNYHLQQFKSGKSEILALDLEHPFVKHILLAHGGTIDFANQGQTQHIITITLPIIESESKK